MKSNNPLIQFQHFDSVNNPSSMHGMYPYRGKISALDAQSVISQLPQKGVLLDPFCGSGTIVYEAQKHGLTGIGVDLNPLALQIARAKVYLDNGESLALCEEILAAAKADMAAHRYDPMPEAPLKSFHEQTAIEIMCVKTTLTV